MTLMRDVHYTSKDGETYEQTLDRIAAKLCAILRKRYRGKIGPCPSCQSLNTAVDPQYHAPYLHCRACDFYFRLGDIERDCDVLLGQWNSDRNSRTGVLLRAMAVARKALGWRARVWWKDRRNMVLFYEVVATGSGPDATFTTARETVEADTERAVAEIRKSSWFDPGVMESVGAIP